VAAADAIGGAAYDGAAADGARVTFTIAADGSRVSSYEITHAAGVNCQLNAIGSAPDWPGAPITSNAFDYTFGTRILFRGAFTGAQSATGTFRLYDPGTSSAAACDTGTVSWTATTTATPPSAGGTGSTGGGSGSTGTSTPATSGSTPKPRYATRVVFRKLSKARLGGKLSSADKACVAGRTVILWLGRRRVASARTHSNAAYSLARGTKLRGHKVSVTVAARTLANAVCSAASSKTVTV
jgi:hypothetical protein